jgi:hypothetical protein
MKKNRIVILILLIFFQVKGQFIKEKAIDISIGIGLSYPLDAVDDEVFGSGFYAQGEYVLTLAKWIDLRPYAGFILNQANAKQNQQNKPEYKSTTNAFLLGGKIRVIAPIPKVAPYFEVGVGASIGSFKTFTPYTNIDKSGLIYHVPVSFGFEIGNKHNFDFAFTYYFNQSVEQFSGAIAFGFSIPLKNN